MRTKAKGPVLVAVTWEDAHSDLEQAWIQADGFTHSPLRVTTVGWIVLQDDTGVTLFSESITEEDSSSFRARSFIPKGMIISITPLAERKSRKSRRPHVSPHDHSPEPDGAIR